MVHELRATRTKASVAAATLPWMLVAPIALYVVGNRTLHSSKGLVFWSGLSLTPSRLFTVTNARRIPAPPFTHAAGLVEASSMAIAVLFLLALIVLLSGWWSFVCAIRRSSTPHRTWALVSAWAPLLTILTDFVLVLIQNHFRPSSFIDNGRGTAVVLNGNPLIVHAIGEVLSIVSVGGWLVAIACVAITTRRAEMGDLDIRFGRSISTIVAGLLTLLLVAFSTWGIGLLMQSHQVIHGEFTTVSLANQLPWLPAVAILLMADIHSVLAAWVARNSWRVTAYLG